MARFRYDLEEIQCFNGEKQGAHYRVHIQIRYKGKYLDPDKAVPARIANRSLGVLKAYLTLKHGQSYDELYLYYDPGVKHFKYGNYRIYSRDDCHVPLDHRWYRITFNKVRIR